MQAYFAKLRKRMCACWSLLDDNFIALRFIMLRFDCVMPCIFRATKDALCIDLCTFFFFCKIQEIVIEEIAFRNLYAQRTCSKKHVHNS